MGEAEVGVEAGQRMVVVVEGCLKLKEGQRSRRESKSLG